jgi:hypothetical protein
MKRLLFTIVLALALLVPSTAIGGEFFYAAPLPGSNAGLELSIKFKNQKPRKVRRVEYHNVFAGGCAFPEGGPAQPGWRVNRRAKFHGTLQTGNYTAAITGKLKKRSNHYKKIVGTIHLQGPPSCDSGVLNYVAHKGG